VSNLAQPQVHASVLDTRLAHITVGMELRNPVFLVCLQQGYMKPAAFIATQG